MAHRLDCHGAIHRIGILTLKFGGNSVIIFPQ
jgi:hypothetical protein